MPLTDLLKKKLRKVWLWASTPRKATKLDVAVVAVALATAYYFAVARPARQVVAAADKADAIAQLKVETVNRQVALDKCLLDAEQQSERQRNAVCKANGKGKNCPLTRAQNEEHQQTAGKARNTCLLKYGLAN